MVVHRRELNGEVLVFGNQGDLFQNAMTWWDHDTGSVWTQPRGEAILGPRKGQRLELYSSTLTTWQAWLDAHPNTVALDSPGWPTGFHLEDMVIVLDLDTEVVAYSIPDLREVGVVNDSVAGVPIAVVIDLDDPTRWAVFDRSLDEVVVDLSYNGDRLVDRGTGTEFDPFVGTGVAGSMSGENLGRLPAFTAFPADYVNFYPEGRVWPSSAAVSPGG